jgi:hypothetical protein
MADKKVRPKHFGYGAQREFCRNNKHTYIEKFSGDPVLMCNYPFTDPFHKKGVCRASTCTDMREIPSEITTADEASEPIAHKGEPGDELSSTAMDDAASTDTDNAGKEEPELQPEEPKDTSFMPCPSND